MGPERGLIIACRGFDSGSPRHLPALGSLAPGLAGRVYTGLLRDRRPRGPMARMLDTSPDDRVMRRFHSFMKSPSAARTRRRMAETADAPITGGHSPSAHDGQAGGHGLG